MSFLDALDNVGRLSQIEASNNSFGVDTAFNWGLATVADVGTSLWNSLTPGSMNISTTSLLGSLGANGAIDTYHQYKDSIELTSFIGGVLVPGFGAIKLAKAVRDGNKAFYALSSAKRVEDSAKLTKMVAEGAQGHTQYRQLRNSMMLRSQAANLMDTVAAEVAIMGTMNSHAFMEDYMADPVKNFGISMLIGTGLTAPFAAIADRTLFRAAVSKVDTAARADIQTAANLYEMPMADTATTLNSMDRAAANIRLLADKPTTNEYTRRLANDMALQIEGAMGDLAKSKILIEDMTPETTNHLRRLLTSPEFMGVDSLKFYEPPKTGFLNKISPFTTEQRPTFKTLFTDAEGAAKQEFHGTHYYSQEHGAFISADHIGDIASAADGSSLAEINKRAGQIVAKELKRLVDPTMLGSAQLEAEYLARIKAYSAMPTDKLKDVQIIGNDLPALNGWVSSINSRQKSLQADIAKLDLSDPLNAAEHSRLLDELTELQQAKITISESDVVKEVRIEELASLPTAGTGVNPDSVVRASQFRELRDLFGTDEAYTTINNVEVPTLPALVGYPSGYGESGFEAVARVLDNSMPLNVSWDTPAIDIYRQVQRRLTDKATRDGLDELFPVGKSADSLSYESKFVLLSMIAGEEPTKVMLRTALESARTLRAGVGSDIPFYGEWVEILNHPLAIKHREAIKANIASADGHIYLRRGLKSSDGRGQTALASYTWSHTTAEDFGTVNVHKISVDDLVGFLYHGEDEFLVASSTRKNLAGEIKDYFEGAPKTAPKSGAGVPKKVEMDFSQAKNFLETQSLASLKKSVDSGIPIEVAALRHNMTSDEAHAIMANYDHVRAEAMSKTGEAIGTGIRFSRWQSEGAITEALADTRRVVVANANSRYHMGEQGDLLDRQRKAIELIGKLTVQERAALNAGNTAAANLIKGRLNVHDNLLAQIHTEWMDLTMKTSESVMAKELAAKVMDSEVLAILKQGLHQIGNSMGGNSMFQSADFVLRQMDQFGRMVNHIGDTRDQIVNATTKRLLEPVSENMRAIGTDQVARTEFAMLDQFRQKTPGPLHWDPLEGRFYTTPLTKEQLAAGEVIDSHVGPATKNPKVLALMDNLQIVSDEMRASRQTISRLGNGVQPADLGFWIPSSKLVGKHYGYVQNLSTHEIKLLVAKDAKELDELMKAYQPAEHEVLMTRPQYELEQRAIMDDGRIKRVTMADVDQTKQGITDAVLDISSARLEDIVGGYTAQINRSATGLLEQAFHDTVTKLDYASELNQRAWTAMKETGWRKAKSQLQNKDVAGDIKDYLLGRNPVHRSEAMRSVNDTYSTILTHAADSMQAAWKVVKPARESDPIAFEKYSKALQAAGIENPFKVFAEADQASFFTRARDGGYAGDPQRIVNAFNAVASTTALKFLEVAQPLVNLLSLPILMSSSISRMVDPSKLHAGSFFENSQMAIMMSGVRRTWSKDARNQRLFQMAKEEGILTSVMTEVDAALSLSRLHTDKGMLSKIEGVLNSQLVKMLSKPSEWGETMVKNVAFGTGVDVALRQLGPKATDRQILIFARDFVKQANGNYSAAQRPAMFQGSAGATMGLFQTYMVTYAQNMYSHIELKDRKGLAKMMLAQAGIFGTYSLPGFNPISQTIGEHFSDEHYDLTTGLYRALPDRLASTLVYGMPSNLVGALHTRGDVSPRIPSGFFEMVAPSMVGQYAETVINSAKALSRMDETAGRAMLEALSTQSASRPIARISELLSGHAVTKAGVTVAGTEEVWSFQGIMARALSTRTLAEATAREAIHLNTVYGQRDRATRQAIVKRLRQDLRSNSVTDAKLDEYATEYLRSGTPQGWRAAVNEAFLANENKGVIDLTDKLKDSPLTLLLEDIDL